MKHAYRILIAEVVLISMLVCNILPVQALWSDIVGVTIAPPKPAEYLLCPTDRIIRDDELAILIGITTDELAAMKSARSLTNSTICQLPKSRIARSLKKTKDPAKPSIDGFVAWRNTQLSSIANSTTINDLNASTINTERQLLVVNDGSTTGTAPFTPLPSGTIDKTRWFPLGPNNVSGRIITMLIDPDYPDTLWAGSAGGGLWKSINSGDNWFPVADFPGNTAISVIKMDPHNNDIMYVGTGDRSGLGVPGNGIFKSIDRGTTWSHVPSTNISQGNTWKTVTDIYIDPTELGKFIASSVQGSGTVVSLDNMQTWQSIVSGEVIKSQSINENPFVLGNIIIPNYGYSGDEPKNYISYDYGHSFGAHAIPFSGRTEIAFAKPNTILLSGSIISPTNKYIELMSTLTSSITIDTISVHIVFQSGSTISGELCIKPTGSSDDCTLHSPQVVSGEGIYTIPGSSLPSQVIPGNMGTNNFEIYLQTLSPVVSGEIQVDTIKYTSNNTTQIDTYIRGESFGSGIIYANVNENRGTLYRSRDLGNSWELINASADTLGNQGWYSTTIWVNPTNSRHLIIGGIDLFESRDGGYSWKKISDWTLGFSAAQNQHISPHADHHAIIADPRFDGTTNRKIYFGTDGGVYRADDINNVIDDHTGWSIANNGLNVTQFYSIAGTGNIIGGGTQDNGTIAYNGGSQKKWSQWLASGDGMDSAIDPSGRYIYGESYNGGYLSRGKIENGIVTPELIGRFAETNIEFRAWEAPLLLDPNNPSRLFYGANSLWVAEHVDTQNASDVVFRKFGNPSLTLGGGNSVITDIAIAKQDSNRIWVAKSNELYYTMSGTITSGEVSNWTKITASNLPGRNITHIEVDYYDLNRVYITYGGYEGSNVWMTTNNGVSWVDISANLPSAPVYTIKQYRNNPNFLYVGTEVGLFYSENGGQSWTTTNEGPANTPVFDIEWYDNNTMLIATFGRGAWALDLNNLTIVTPPRASVVSGEVIHTLSGVQTISSYRDPIDVQVSGGQTVFYTLDGSTPLATSSGTTQGGMFYLSGATIIDPTLLSHSFTGGNIVLKVRSRDFANNWSDVSSYVYRYKDTITPLGSISWGSGSTTLTSGDTARIMGSITPTESGSLVSMRLVGSSIISGEIVRSDIYGSTGETLEISGLIDRDGYLDIADFDTNILSDGIVHISYNIADALGNMSSTATGTLYRNVTPTNIVFNTGSLSQSGVLYQSGVFYSSKKDVYAVISTDEIAKISFTGTNIGFPVSFWNQIETATGKYQSILPLTLTGGDGVKSYTLYASDMNEIYAVTLTGSIIYDTTVPAITSTSYSSGMQQSLGYYRLEGLITDNSPVDMRVNNIPVNRSGNTWNTDILIQIGNNRYTYTATDILGNTATGSYIIEGRQFVLVGAGGGGGGGSSSSTLGIQSQISNGDNSIPIRDSREHIDQIRKKINTDSPIDSIFEQQILPIITKIGTKGQSIEKINTEYGRLLRSIERGRKTEGNIENYYKYVAIKQYILRSYVASLRSRR